MGRAPGSESHTCGPPLSCHCGCSFGTQPDQVVRAARVGQRHRQWREPDWGRCADQDPPCPLFSRRVIHSGHGVFQWVPCVSGPRDPGGD